MPYIVPKTSSLVARIAKNKLFLLITLIVLCIIAIPLVVILSGIDLKALATYGYPWLFLVNLVCSLTIIFPLPGAAVNIAAAGLLNPFWVGVVASVGGTLGEMTGYLAGYWGQGVAKMEQRRMYQRVERWMKRYGSLTVFAFALTPLPFDLAGIAAGVLRFPVWKFLLACWAGRLIRCIAEAYLGYTLFKPFFPDLL